MSIQLKKGGSINLSKKEPGLSKIMVGLGWEMSTGAKLDLDVSVFMIGANGKLPQDEYFVFYNNLKSPDGSVQHTGDNRTGAGDEDDEMILVNLSAISSNVQELVLIASIHEAGARNHHFGLLKDAYIRLVDVERKREVCIYDLDQVYGGFSDVEFGRLKRVGAEWEFVATGIGEHFGLQGFVDKYA